MKKIAESTKAKRKSVERYISYDDAKRSYYVCLNYGKTEDSTQNKKQYVTFKSLKEAREKVHQFYGDKARGKMVVPRQLTVVEWLNTCAQNMKIAGKSESYCYQIELMIKNHIAPFFGDMELQKLKASDIDNYAGYVIGKGLSLNTYRKHYDFINFSLNKALERELVLKNVCKQVEKPRKEKAEISFYDTSQVATLINNVEGTDMDLFVQLAFYCGLRRGEILGLAWEDIDFEHRQIQIKYSRTTAGKTVLKGTKTDNSARIIGGIHEYLIWSLQREYDRQKRLKEAMGSSYPTYERDYICRLSDGRVLAPNYASVKFKKLVDDNGLPHITPHGGRHSYASIANAQGMTMYDISKALGHSNISITAQIYTDLFKKDNSETMVAVGTALSDEVMKQWEI